MSDNGAMPATEQEAKPAPMGTEASVCPVCSERWEPMPFYRERRMLYQHLKTEHEWSPEQVAELRGMKPAAKAAKPSGTVKRPPAKPNRPRAAHGLSGTDFSKRVTRMGELAPRIATTGNQLLLQGAIMLGWFPAPLLIEFKSEPQTGLPLPQWDRPTDFGQAIMLDGRECTVYAAAWAFSENTALMVWLENRIGTIAPLLAAAACAVVTFGHLKKMRDMANSPAVVAFKDQMAALEKEMRAQMERQAAAQQEQQPPAA